MPVISILGRWRQDNQEFKVILNSSESEANLSHMKLLSKSRVGSEKKGKIY